VDLRRILLFAAERHPQRVAMAEGSKVLTYQQWVQRVLSMAGGLAENGVARGDRVAIGMRNSVDAATVFFATQVLGAVAVPFNFRFKSTGIGQVLADAEATAIISDAGIVADEVFAEPGVSARMLKVAAAPNPAPGWLSLSDLSAHGSATEGGTVSVDDLSTILYTSGTTGRPKGVPLTHGNTIARITSYIASAGPMIGDDMRALGVAPIYHTVGLHWVLCQMVYVNGEYHPLADVNQAAMLALIHDKDLTYLFGSPTLFHIMLDGRPSKYDVLPSVRHTTFGSAPMPVPLFNEMVRCFANGKVNQVYGTTELSVPMVTNDCARHPVGALHCTADQRVRIVSPGGSPTDTVVHGES
jgi:2-furoate---CoA ligase